MAGRGFLTGGTWCLDRNLTVPFWPGEDMAVAVVGEAQSGGGSACNLALGIRRLDPAMPVATMGLVGSDPAGDFLVALAAENGLDPQGLIRTDAAPTMMTEAFQSQATGHRTHIIHPGTNRLLAPEHFDFAEARARIFHLGLPGIHERMDGPAAPWANGWVAVLARARAAGLQTNLELVTAPEEAIRRIVRPCLPHLTTLVVNDYEIGALAERQTIRVGRTDAGACAAAAEEVLAEGAMEVVVVHHVHGAELVARDGTRLFKPSVRVPAEEVKGANGAGDAFASGFLYGWHEGWPAERALALGHAAAAACLRSASTCDGVLPVAECLGLADRWGWREPG